MEELVGGTHRGENSVWQNSLTCLLILDNAMINCIHQLFWAGVPTYLVRHYFRCFRDGVFGYCIFKLVDFE